MGKYAEITKRQSIINNTETDYWNDFEANRVIPTLIDIIEKQRVHFGRIIGYTENLFDNVPAWRANQIAKEAKKLTEE